MALTNKDLRIGRGTQLATEVVGSFLGYQRQKQSYLSQASTHGYNAQSVLNDGKVNAGLIRKANSFKLGEDKVAYATSGLSGGSKLQALADNALTREMNAARAESKAYAKAQDLKAAQAISSAQAKSANLFSFISALPAVADTFSWWKGTRQAQGSGDLKSEYLGY